MSTFKLSAKKFIIIALVLFAIGVAAIWYIFTVKFTDTTKEKADFSVSATDLIHEFKKSDKLANTKYSEKIIAVSGTVSSIENADSTVNIKMTDVETGDYLIFDFQQQNIAEAKSIKEGQKVIIKGSCSGGAYSSILGAEFITFKRCALSK